MKQEQLKQQAAEYALRYIKSDMIVAVGTGSTVDFFIQALASIKGRIEAAVASSKQTESRLRELHIPVIPLSQAQSVDLYIDGADEINAHKYMIKGGGAALTGEKILAFAAKHFICIADQSKYVDVLGRFPLPIEVIPLARSMIARHLVSLGAMPEYRENVLTDYGNEILDVKGLRLEDPITIEGQLNQIPGVVTNGLFALRPADTLVLAKDSGIEVI